MRVVRIHAAAAEEAAEAAAWYEQEVIPLTSLLGVSGAHGVKRLLLRRFPYSVIVREGDEAIFVIAFVHHARHPRYWRERLRG